MSNYSVSLVGPAPWGFRLQGGKDFNVPLSISRLNDGGKAARAHVGIGDVVLTIDGISTDGMTHLEAQNKIKACTGNLNMTLQRVASVQKPDLINVPKGEPTEVVKPVPIASAVAPKVTATASVAYNKTPRPFGAVTSSKVTSIPSPSSAFTPAQASAPSLTAAAPAPFAAPGLHVHTKPNPEQRSPVPSAAKPAVNVPWQPAAQNAAPSASAGDGAQDVAEGPRRGFRENQGESKQQNGKNPPKRPPRKHIVDTYTEFYHTPTHSDASKKRLIEDTEDWHPRTGTTQSRSFRILAQITGTDHMKEPENEAAKKTNDSLEATQPSAFTTPPARSVPACQDNADARPAPASTTSAAALKPVGPLGSAKGWQPPNQAVPASGWTSNSIKSPGTTASSEKPDTAPQLNEQDTLVQRAEHIPAGKRTPMCAHCNQVIRGPFLVALGKSWHPEEFNCAHCKTSMAYIGFVEEKGMLYCEVCYEKFFAPECSKCQRKILGEVINALKQTWHVSCFVCVACHNPIRNNVFHLEDGDPYCETDYYALFGTMCHGCEFPIEAGDRFLEALGHTWHDTCFVCSVCSDSLEGQTFFSKKDKPLCKKHAHSINI
ncbi:PDZ and LIM domain protein 5 isoform X1 [Manacus candei]|uniref:PDZ and LIM domain protein 5 isoform X1 n=1 Tax=Manacus candei TaxID=415023 RepID=UPI002227CE6F|nr:PDZ and LIM domain protein 5 isoform X1 [Manacus candei]XP_051645722.1 PDZ and LIM domain protein 5 isoform X1 [Manacus candei]XP_051645723.1 PDZ and LIM domain protein 5 isoform X1 [Manacus candei]XP_051645724.1 PDZ and LIM domain protein 5 isoform X1 [Manacus candei]